jgi:hypothetical protein
VLAEDALEDRRQRGERGTRAVVARVGLELDAPVALVLERVPHQQQLRADVRARPPRRRHEPRVADLHRPVVRAVVQEARVPDELAVEGVREPHVDARPPLVEVLVAPDAL